VTAICLSDGFKNSDRGTSTVGPRECTRSADAATDVGICRFATSPRRLNCAKAVLSPTAWRTGQVGTIPDVLIEQERLARLAKGVRMPRHEAFGYAEWNLRKKCRTSLRPVSTRYFPAASLGNPV
jgi:hypothetical protein